MSDAQTVRTGDGKTELTIGPENGKVVMGFPHPISWFASDPLNAAQIGREMIEQAVRLGADVRLELPRPELTSVQHAAIVTRVHLVMKNQMEKGVKPAKLAEQLVDIVLSAAP